jgi:hypothetical protein
MAIDDVIKQMELDEWDGATKLPPIQYARLRGIYPQKVYGAIRNGKLERTRCECGRPCVEVDAADEYFGFKKGPLSEEGEASESPVHE